VPYAFVEPRPGAALAEADLKAHCRANLAHFKVPKRFVMVELPKTATGKIQKFELRQTASELAAQPQEARS
jgi:fatty-acyl-CoA synthase